MSANRPGALRPEHCSICGEYPGVGVFCSECGVLSSHPISGDFAAPYLQRLLCELLDLIIFLALPLWLAWMWRSCRDGQSPAKSLLNLYVIHESGQSITPQRLWVRELLMKRLLLGLFGYALGLLGPIINAAWILLNPDRQCIHDRMVGTLVVVRRAAPAPISPPAASNIAALRLPPPAPRGPRLTPNPLPAQSTTNLPLTAPTRPISSPELEALELERPTLSQTEYERRLRILQRQQQDVSQQPPA